MEHVVFFPVADGTSGFRRVPSLEEAVRLVEHLRNVEGVEHVSVHALTEVPLQFRAYYRVEVPAPVAVLAPVAVDVPVQPVRPAVEQLLPASAAEPLPTPVVEVEPESPAEAAPALALVDELPVADEAPDAAPVALATARRPRAGGQSLGFFA